VLAAAVFGTAPAWAQGTTTTTEESPVFTVSVPAPAPTPAPTPPVTPSSTSSSGASAPPAPVLPRQLASTGTDPWLIIGGGLGLIALSLVVRTRVRALLRTRGEEA